MLPAPGSLSTQIRPPINRTSVAEIVRPRPVPPNRRVVDPSAWRKASKIASCFSGGMPMPVSVTLKCSVVLPVARAIFPDGDEDVAALGELERVADQVGQDLLHPRRIADDAGRHLRVDVANELEPLLVRAQRERLERVGNRRARRERHRFELELARFDLREVENVVEDRQQRVGRASAPWRGCRAGPR